MELSNDWIIETLKQEAEDYETDSGNALEILTQMNRLVQSRRTNTSTIFFSTLYLWTAMILPILKMIRAALIKPDFNFF